MPSADDYEAAARVWEVAAENLDALARQLAWSLPESTIGPCPVRGLLDDALGVGLQNIVKSAEEFRSLKSACIGRQFVCAEYDRDVAAHRVVLAEWGASDRTERGPRPTDPVPPYPWVEASR